MPSRIKIKIGDIASNDTSCYIHGSNIIGGKVCFYTHDYDSPHGKFYWPLFYIKTNSNLLRKEVKGELFTPGDLSGEVLDIIILPNYNNAVIHTTELYIPEETRTIEVFSSLGRDYSTDQYDIFLCLLVSNDDITYVSARIFSKHY